MLDEIILVIDKSKEILFAFESLFLKEGLKVKISLEFNQAFDNLELCKIRAIFIDSFIFENIVLESNSKLEKKLLNIPVILLTSHHLQNNVAFTTNINIDAFLEKPISINDIRTVMKKLEIRLNST